MSLKLFLYSADTYINYSLMRKQVSLLFILTAFAYMIKQFIDSSFSLSNPYIILAVIILSLSILFYFTRGDYISYGQVLLLLGAGTFVTFKQYDSVYGFVFYAGSFLLGKRYRILESRPIASVAFYILYYVVLIEVSLYLSSDESSGVWHLLFLLSFIHMVYLLFKSEMDRLSKSEQTMQNSIHELIQERSKLKSHISKKQSQLNELEKEIQSIQNEKKPYDLAKIGLTPAELRIVKALVKTRGSNKEISELLGIKENTVKQHLYKIFNKMGVDERFQIIDLCKYNFE